MWGSSESIAPVWVLYRLWLLSEPCSFLASPQAILPKQSDGKVVVKQLELYLICKSYQWWIEKGRSHCLWSWRMLRLAWLINPSYTFWGCEKQCFLTDTATSDDTAKLLMQKPTGDTTDNLSKAVSWHSHSRNIWLTVTLYDKSTVTLFKSRVF